MMEWEKKVAELEVSSVRIFIFQGFTTMHDGIINFNRG